MTNYPYRALVGCVGLLIGTLSGCAAGPTLPSSAPFQTQAAPAPQACPQPCSSEVWAKTHPVETPEAAPPAPSAADMKLKELYAKGFKEGFTDATRARIAADKRQKSRKAPAQGQDVKPQ